MRRFGARTAVALVSAIAISIAFDTTARADLPPVFVNQVKDIEPGPADGSPFPGSSPYSDDRLRGVDIDGVLIFAADGPEGTELWRSDGTEAGTFLLKDIAVGSTFHSNPRYLTEFSGEVFFAANVPATQSLAAEELWKTDGTEAGTVMVKDINPSQNPIEVRNSSPHNLTDVDGTLFFLANSDGDSDHELWKSDGTESGTVMVKDIGSSAIKPAANFNAIGDRLFFTFDDGGAVSGKELWTSDGTSGGTKMVEEIGPGSAYGVTVPSPLPSSDFISFDGSLFFRANDGTNGEELWRSDGTAAGTEMVKNLDGNAGSALDLNPYFAVRGGELFFAGEFLMGRSDGTEAGTELISGTTNPTEPMVVVDGTIFYADGSKLYGSDGTGAGTSEIMDFVSEPGDLTNFNGTLYFSADDGVHGIELWRSDGTPAGTERVTDINDSGDSLVSPKLTVVGDRLFFRGDDGGAGPGDDGTELWRAYTDTTPPETTIDSGPAEGETIENDEVTFTFSSNEQGSNLSCSFDGGASEPCDSGTRTYSGLAEGDHTFSVTATDSAPFSNVDPTPATRTFTYTYTVPEPPVVEPPVVEPPVVEPPVDTTAPKLRLKGRKKQKSKKRIVLKATCLDEGCVLRARGSIKVKVLKPNGKVKKTKKLRLKRFTISAPAGKKVKLKLKLKGKAKRLVKKVFRKKVSKATIRVTATDVAGNRTAAKRKVKVSKKRKRKSGR